MAVKVSVDSTTEELAEAHRQMLVKRQGKKLEKGIEKMALAELKLAHKPEFATIVARLQKAGAKKA
jgi:hypothetical protein